VGGVYTQEPSWTLRIVVGGGMYGPSGRLTVTGKARLGGPLRVVRAASYTAKSGDTQRIVTAAAIEAPCARLSIGSAGPGRVFKPTYSATALLLTVV